ncbi:2-keto-4-pentenoate hydratase [Azohydromonas caseinilytica]|uniref:Decarboxylase n=1 Tax=Azohydromonas caseinilytica TaxID=2728836 RepID=A0A848F4G0_9BURK|nr:fumarylacetoacetate hydrolase family protein [Azohydromonas caseinilytica]NML13968.1 decarboxylase [Azohydromonas caseinilytica]
MLSIAQLQSVADEIQSARDGTRQLQPFSARLPGFDLGAAYAAAALGHQARLARGERPVGRKLGFTNPDMWDLHGVRAPVWAWLYEDSVSQLTSGSAVCSLSRFAEPRIEPEIVFGLRATPPARADEAALLACIEWVAHGFEIVQSHFPGWRFEAADTVVDQALHGTLLIGAPLSPAALGPDPATALRDFRVELCCDGAPRETGQGSNVLGSPLAALGHLVELLAGEPSAPALQPGDIVTTGTLTTALPVRPGERWSTALRGIALPGLEVEFKP